MSDLVRRLRGDHEVAATGQLSLDRDEARTKLQRFRLPDPHMYVLQLVKAASVLGATKIEFTIGPSTTVCVFDAVFEDGALDDVWSRAFDERTTAHNAAIHNLALGLSSAQALNPEYIEVESGGEKLLIRDGEERLLLGEARDHTKVIVKEKFRLGHLVEFFATFLDELPEIRALMSACEYSLMAVFCNGGRVNHIWTSKGSVDFEDAADGPIATVGQRGLRQTKYVLLRDDVHALSVFVPAVIMPGRAAQNSRSAPMDLTGLNLRERPVSFPRDVRSAYHRRLLYWLDRNESPVQHQRYQLEELCGELADPEMGELGDGSRELLARLLDSPNFESATGTGELVPLRRQDGVIEVSRQVFPLATSHQGSVALIDAHPDLVKLLTDLGIGVRDVTAVLRDLERQARNRARFEAQPVWFERAPRSTPSSLIVEVGELWGRVMVQEDAPRASGSVFVDGRFLFTRETALPFDLEVDGPLQPNPFYDNVVRDEAYDRLALGLIAAARRLFSRVTDRTRALALLTSLARRQFGTELLRTIGYSRADAVELLSDEPSPGDDDEYRWLIREAQTLSWLPIFEDLSGVRYSLREIIDSGKPPLFSKLTSAARLTDRLVLNPTPQQRRFLKLLWPEAGDLETLRLRETGRERFMRQPRFTTPVVPKALFRHRVNGDGFTLDLELLGSSNDGARAEAYLVWADRLVARHRWSAPLGYWRVTARSEGLYPLSTYEDVRRDDEFWKLTGRFATAVFEALAAWRRHVVREGAIEAEGIELFMLSSLRHDEVHEMRLLAWKVDGVSYRTVLPTLQQLADAAELHGVQRYAHPDEVDRLQGQPNGLVLMLPSSIHENEVRLGPLAACSFRHLPPPRMRARPPAERPTTLGDGLIHFVDTVGGFEVATELVETTGEPIHTIELIHHERVIERVEHPDFASFRSLVRGPELTPDLAFSSIVSGRAGAIDAAVANARRVIEEACTSLGRFGSEPLRAALRAVAMTGGHEHESWWETLVHTPLFETPSGFESVVDRARRFASMNEHHDPLRELADMLRVARGDQTDLLHDFTLATIQWSDDQDPLCVVGPGQVSVLRTHPLVARVVGGDTVAAQFLASCVATEINAYYAQITDTDELELQHRLMRVNQ